MEKFESQPTPEPIDFDREDWIRQVNRASIQVLNEMRIEAGLEPHPLESAEYFNIDDYTGQFYD